VNVLANVYYMRFDDFVKSYQANSLNDLEFYPHMFIFVHQLTYSFCTRTGKIIPQKALIDHK